MENACAWWLWRDEAEARGRFDPSEVRTFDLEWLKAVPAPCRQCARCHERGTLPPTPVRPGRKY